MVRKKRHINPRAAAEGGLSGATSRIRDLVRREDLSDVRERHPDLAEALDAVAKHVDTIERRSPDRMQGTFESYWPGRR